MSATPTVGVVRVPWNDHVYLKRVLDVGAEAVLIPSIDTADEARAAVAACLYPTRGRRGTASSSVRASSYGMAPDYVATCAENLLIACQIESATAVDNIDAILAVEGIDLMFIGPFDLSATVGQMGNLKHPEVARLIEHAEDAHPRRGSPDGHRSAPRLHLEGHVRARLPIRERRQRRLAVARRRARRRQGVSRALPQKMMRMSMNRCHRLVCVVVGLLLAVGAYAMDVRVSGLLWTRRWYRSMEGDCKRCLWDRKARRAHAGVRGTRCCHLRYRRQARDAWMGHARIATTIPPRIHGADRNVQGHFYTVGQVNGRSVRFVVDTGATLISIPASEARRLSIDYQKGQKALMRTANGNTTGFSSSSIR